MRPTLVTRTVLVVMATVAVIGALDAGIGGSWDQVVILSFLALASLLLLIRTSTRRPLVPIRADLHRWFSRRSAVTGERTEHLVDRALSAFRADLVGGDDPPTPTGGASTGPGAEHGDQP